MYTFKQHALSALFTAVGLVVAVAVLSLFGGGFTAISALVQDTVTRDIRANISLTALVIVLVAVFQQVVLRVVIFRK